MASTRDMVEELCLHLDAQSTAITVGTNLFANDLPPLSTRACLAVIETPGGPPEYHFGNDDLPSWERLHVQLTARTTAPASGATIPNPVAAKRLLRRGYTILSKIANETVQGSTYLRAEPLQAPFLARTEPDGRQVYAANFEVTRVPSTNGLG